MILAVGSGLPLEVTSLVGRRRELEQVQGLLEEFRLVTVLGPGGMGKTRLARALLAARLADGQGAALWVELAEVETAEGLTRAVASALGVEGEPTAQVLGAALAARGALWVALDNFEQLVDEAALVLDAWLRAAPELRLLVTSRRRLELPGEVCFELPPLGLGEGEALALLMARARQHRPELEAANDPALARIVERLDGIPLAIELAAAQLRLMSPAQLLARLDRALLALGGAPRTAASRHRTVRLAVEGSWEALTPELRAALVACAAFRGGFTLEAAEVVLDGVCDDPWGAVGELQGHSLLHRWPVGEGAVRLGLYQTIQAFVVSQGSPSDEVHRAHARWFASLPLLRDAGITPGAVAGRALERDNLLAALAWAEARADHGEAGVLGVGAALRLVELLVLRGPVSQALLVADRGLALAAEVPAALEAELRIERGRLHLLFGDPALGRADLEAAGASLGGAIPGALQGPLLELEATLARVEGRPPDAERAYRAALDALRAHRPEAMGRALSNFAGLLAEAGRLAEARAAFAEALDVLAAVGDVQAEAVAVGNLGLLEQEAGELARAEDSYRRALELHLGMGYRRFIGITRCDLAGLRWEQGRPREALALYDEGLESLRLAGDLRHAALMAAAREACAATVGAAPLSVALRAAGVEAPLAEVSPAERLYAAMADAFRAGNDESIQMLASQFPARSDSDELRLAHRQLAVSVEALRRRWRRLLVAPDARWFETPEGERVELGRRAVLRRVLEALVQQRLGRGEEPLDFEALVALGWPGERLLPEAAANRLHVALSTLRRLGLRALIEHVDGGYRLDPATPVLRA